jgi:predicted kinase
MLLMVGGLMGTGKSTLAQALQHELGWALISSDAVRKHLARLHPKRPQAEAFGQGIYSPEWTARTYDVLLQEARRKLADGRSVLLDATFLRRSDRQAAVRHAAGPGKRALFVECTCPREVALQRLGQRWKARAEGSLDTAEIASGASDARPDLYDAQASMWEDFVQDEEPESAHVVVTTTQSLAASVRQVLDSIGTSQFPFRPHSD